MCHPVLLVALCSAQIAPEPLQEYALDAGHSIIEFSIGFAYTRIKGRFTSSHGTILYDPVQPSNSSITVVIETKSLDTGWPHRDEHLRTSDFFDVSRFPTIVFQSERMTPAQDGWIAEGTLSMHGVTKRIAIPFHLVQPPTRDPQSRWMMLDAAGSVRLARRDFGILGGDAFNSWFDKARSATMADSVDVSLEVEGWNVDQTSQRPKAVEDALGRVTSIGVDSAVRRLRGLRATTAPEKWQAYFRGQDLLVRGLVATKRLPEALTLALALAELFPDLPSAHVVYGYTLALSGGRRAAAAHYAKAKEVLQPEPPDTATFKQVNESWYWLDLLARGAIESDRFTEATSLARAITELYPRTATAFVTYGRALAASGDVRVAGEQYAAALALDPMETRALEWRRRLLK